MRDRDSLVEIGAANAPSAVEVTVVEHGRGRRVCLRATAELSGFATGWFFQPTVYVALDIVPADAEPELLGFAFTQFALPVLASRALDFDFQPAPNLHAPPALGLLMVRAGDHTTLVAPLTNVHEQIVAVSDGGLRWGWHGDLAHAPAGFETSVGLYDGSSPSDVLAAWAADLRGDAAPVRRALHAHPLTSHLSYWTDNGAAYWYRTEPGRSNGASVADAVRRLRADGVPVHAVELDSWFYRHEIARPITDIGYPEEVPPTGMLEWLPRPDAFDDQPSADGDDDDDGGRDEIEQWADGLGRPPLVLHARHVSPSSPYLADGEWWVDLLAAHPVDPGFFRRWFDDAARWGACCIEQDWMMMFWFGVRELRAEPGRARAWQDALDRHAADTGVGLLWCMATPADLVHAASLTNVVAVRTSDDYRFAEDPAVLWIWYLTVNRLAAALGLAAFKDVFFSHQPGPGADAIDGDVHAELEALLSALAAGPVGIGDRIGHTDREVVLRTCDEDGRLRHVDRPVGLIDACLFGAPARGERLAWASTTATVGGEVWTYVVALNASTPAIEIDDDLDLATLGIGQPRSVLDWRAATTSDTHRLSARLAPRDWRYFVVAPPGRRADEGDPTKYVTVPTRA